MKVTDSKHRLLELMSAYDITQQDIADKTGINKSAISMYVNGNRIPRQDKVSMICDAYNLDPAWLMGYDVPMERRNPAVAGSLHGTLISKFSKLSDRDQEIVMNMIDSMLDRKS